MLGDCVVQRDKTNRKKKGIEIIPKYAIVAKENRPHDASWIEIPEFREHLDSLDAAVRLVEDFCRRKGLRICEVPSAVGCADDIYSDCSGGQHAIVKAWDCGSDARIHICEIGKAPTGPWWPYADQK